MGRWPQQGKDRHHRERDRPEQGPHRRPHLRREQAGVPHPQAAADPHCSKDSLQLPHQDHQKELVANKINETWAASNWAKRNAIKEVRAGLTDLDRFKLRKAKSARNKIVAKALNSKKKALRKAGKI